MSEPFNCKTELSLIIGLLHEILVELKDITFALSSKNNGA